MAPNWAPACEMGNPGIIGSPPRGAAEPATDLPVAGQTIQVSKIHGAPALLNRVVPATWGDVVVLGLRVLDCLQMKGRCSWLVPAPHGKFINIARLYKSCGPSATCGHKLMASNDVLLEHNPQRLILAVQVAILRFVKLR